MAKKVSPIVIPAVIDTSGVDRGVASINSKLKGISGTGVGVGGGGNGNATGNFGSGGGAASAAIGAAAASAFGRQGPGSLGGFLGSLSGYTKQPNISRMGGESLRLLRQSTVLGRGFTSLMDWSERKKAVYEDANRALRQKWGRKGAGLLGDAGLIPYRSNQARLEMFQRMRTGFGNAASAVSAFTLSAQRGLGGAMSRFGASALGRFASVGGLAALGSYERIVGSQFADFNAFQGYGKGVSRGISNEFYRSQKTTPNLFQSFMLGAYRKGGKGGLLTGDNGLLTAGARGLRAMSYYAGALLNNPGDTLLNTFNPTSSLWLNAQGINDPYNGARDNQGLGDMLGGMLRNASFSAQITDQMVQFNAQGAAALATNKRSNQ